MGESENQTTLVTNENDTFDSNIIKYLSENLSNNINEIDKSNFSNEYNADNLPGLINGILFNSG